MKRKHSLLKKWTALGLSILLIASTGLMTASAHNGYKHNGNSHHNSGSHHSGSSSTISQTRAKEIALKHANVAAKDATWTCAKLDWDDGCQVYDLEFCAGGIEYEYEIHATNGTVLDCERERHDNCRHNQSGHHNQNSNQNTNSCIGVAKAKDIACRHVGLTTGQVTMKQAKFDTDDGQQIYDIEFYHDGYKHEFEIHATSGKILSYDREYKNKSTASTTKAVTSSNGSTAYIGLEKAKEIALTQAGESAANVKFTKAKLEYDDGAVIYDIEFCTSSLYYEVEINAANGSVLDFSQKGVRTNNTGNTQASSPTTAGTAATSATTAAAAAAKDIGGGRAKEIALAHAGLTAADVSFVRVEADVENSRKVYDVEFYQGNTEYDYEIDAQSGEILEADLDIEDFTIPAEDAPESIGFFARIFNFFRNLFRIG